MTILYIIGGIIIGAVAMIAVFGYLWNRGGKGSYF
mgnify:CR=1 FL=1